MIYADGATRYLRWCVDGHHLPMSRAALNSWIAGLLDTGAAPGTARIRQLAVRRFASWLTAGGELPVDPFPGVGAPRVEPPLVEPLTDAELRALLKTCAVSDTAASVEATLHHRRDEAIIRLMFEIAIRSGELVDLQLYDLGIVARLITIRCGKGGRGWIIPIRQATTEALLVSPRTRSARRAQRAGVQDFGPHRLRHTAAHRWLAAGGSEYGLMAIAGWTRTDMLIRYTQAHAAERAAGEARRLNLGDL